MENDNTKIQKLKETIEEMETYISKNLGEKIQDKTSDNNISRMAERSREMVDLTSRKAADLIDRAEEAAKRLKQKLMQAKNNNSFSYEKNKKTWISLGTIISLIIALMTIKKIMREQHHHRKY